MLDNLLKSIQGDEGQGAKASGSLNSTAMETLKLVANQAIELQATVDEQNEVIRELISEIKKLKSEQKMLQGDLNLVHIDQKDLSKQLKLLKTEAEKDKYIEEGISDLYAQSASEDLSFDEIAEHFYPNYQQNSMLNPHSRGQRPSPEQYRAQGHPAQHQASNYRYERKVVTPEHMRNQAPQDHLSKAEEILNHPAIKRNVLNKKQSTNPQQQMPPNDEPGFGRYPKFLR